MKKKVEDKKFKTQFKFAKFSNTLRIHHFNYVIRV